MSGANSYDVEISLNSEQPLAADIWRLYDEWKGYRSLAESRWGETKKYVYATSTRDTTNVKNPWDNSTHRPKLHNIHHNLTVNTFYSLFPDDNWLRFEGSDKKSSALKKRARIEGYMRTKHKLSDFEEEIRDIVNDWILYGNCFAGVEYIHEQTTDPITGEVATAYVGPRIYRISPYDIVFNAVASSFDASPKIIQSYMTLGELERSVQENYSQPWSQEALDLARKDRQVALHSSEDSFNKYHAGLFDGYGGAWQYYTSGHVVVREFYGDYYDKLEDKFYKNHVITVIDGRYVLRAEPLNTISGRPNIFHCGWKNRPDNLWAMGPLDNLVGMQYRINHLENAKADAFDQMLDPDKVFYGDPVVEQVGAALYYYVPENGDVKYLRPDTTVLNADLQIQDLEDKMELYAGAPREALGIRSPGEKTAFEVDKLINAASRVFEYQTDIFSVFLEKLINAELEVAKLFLNTSDVVKVMDDTLGVEVFLSISREDLISNGKLIPVGSRNRRTKSLLTQTLATFYQTGLSDPEVAQHFPASKIAEMWADLLDYEELFIPFGRIQEQLQSQRLQQEAVSALQEESMTNVGAEEIIDEEQGQVQGQPPIIEGAVEGGGPTP